MGRGWFCLSSVTAVLVAACGGGGGGDDGGNGLVDAVAPVSGTAHVVHGASTVSTAAMVRDPAVASDGFWVVSPDAGRATLVSLSFRSFAGVSHDVLLEDCTPEYQRADAALTEVLACPFQVPAGTYDGFGVNMMTTYEVLIDDAVIGLYTDPAAPTLLASVPPGGGAEFVTVDLSASGPTVGLNYLLPTPLVVADDPVSITIVADMFHTTQISVSGGEASFRTDGVWQPMILFGSVNGVAQAEYYATVGTTDSYNYSNPAVDGQSVRVFYADDGQAAALQVTPTTFFITGGTLATQFAAPADPAVTPPAPDGSRAGGYLGLDGNETLCWAQASNGTWQDDVAVYSLPRATGLGSIATISRDDVTSAPPPTAGVTYASGCPALTADATLSITLAAD